jgi:hypothetical protein
MSAVSTIRAYLKDFPRYAREVLRIQTKDAQLLPFELNRAQRRLWEIVAQDIEARRPVRIYILKARQLGFSTLIQGLAYWVVSLRKNRTALVTAHEEGAAANMFLKSQIFYKSSPAELRPMLRLSNRQELHFANPDPKATAENMGLESKIAVRTANNRNLGASMTVQFLHLSEFAKYERVLQEVKVAMATVLQTVPRLPDTFVFLETTADGVGYAKDFWDGDNGYRKIFVSWVADETYTIPHDQLTLRLDQLDEVDDAQFGNEAQVYKHVLDELRFWYPEFIEELTTDELPWQYREALCRMQWRRMMIADQFHGDRDLFRQEYPITPEEAFLTTGAAVFDQRKLRDNIQALRVADANGRPIPDALVFPPTTYRFDRNNNDFYHARYGPLRVYEPPSPNHRYVIGSDVAEGLERGDTSVAQVLRLPDLLQVATYEDRLDPDDFADVLFHIGRIFGWAPLCVEVNGPGFATNLRLGKVLHYPNLYMREVFDRQSKTHQRKWGWHTNRQTKNVLITDLRASLRDDFILYRDLKTLEDMTKYVQRDDGTMGAVRGEHDDTVMALGLAYQMAIQRGLAHMRRPSARTPAGPPPEYSFQWWADKVKTANGGEALTADYYRQKFGLKG